MRDNKLIELLNACDDIDHLRDTKKKIEKVVKHEYETGGFEQDDYGHKAYGVCARCGRSEQHWSHDV